MEFIGAVSEGEWSSLSGMYTAEEADFMAQLIGNCPFSSMGVTEANFWPGHESTMNNMAGNFEGSHFSSETTNSNLYKISQGGDCSDQRYYLMSTESDHPMLVPNNRIDSSMSIDFGTGDVKNINSYLIEGDHDQCLNQETSEGNAQEYAANRPEAAAMGQKRYELTIQEPAKEDKSTNPTKSMKRSQSKENVQMTKRNIKSKKGLHVETRNYEEDGNADPNRQSSGSCCSGDDTIASHGNEHSQELSGGMTSPTSSLSSKEASALNLSGKSRARRGSATDPQSLYARKRREKINERLRVLQGLVPNGTKVDISTMLEEAVHYVKFLQLQIKLLSSDDMWMYAPICYNGMDLGLDMKLTPPKQ